jgi:hypothetical protein
MNVYQVDTLIQLGVTFYNTALNVPADPLTVALFVEDPTGVVTEIATNLLVRTGVGAYYSNFMPTMPGEWVYKWQVTGNVEATSRDTRFYVKASDLIDD